MSRLFIELYLDEDVDVLIAPLLRARGFVIVTTQEAGQLGSSDAEQLAYAVSQHKTLLTHNRVDFEALAQTYLAVGQLHDGIVVAVRRLPREIASRRLRILNTVTAEEMQNQVRYIWREKQERARADVGRTRAWSRLPIAYAPLQLPAAAHA